MDEEGDDKTNRQEGSPEDDGRQAVDATESPYPNPNPTPNPPLWMDMSYTSCSPLFDMLSSMAPGTTVADQDALDIEDISSSSPSSSSSSSSLGTDSTLDNGSNKKNCIIWVEPFMSCRIFERLGSDDPPASQPARPPGLRHMRRGGMRKATHGPTSVNLRHHSAMTRCAERRCVSSGGTGDVETTVSDIEKTPVKDPQRLSPDSNIDSVHGECDSAQRQDYSAAHKVSSPETAEEKEHAQRGKQPEPCGPSSRWTSNYHQCDFFQTNLSSSQHNNNHPTIGGQDSHGKDSGNSSPSRLVKHGDGEATQEGNGDTKAEVKCNENDVQTTTVPQDTPNPKSMPSPFVVKTIDEPTSNSRPETVRLDKGKSGNNSQEMQQSKAFTESCRFPIPGLSADATAEKPSYPFAHGTFRSWRPHSKTSNPGGLVSSPRTAWSAHVTNEQKRSRELQSRHCAERCQMNEPKSCRNRTRQTTRLSDNPYERLPSPSEPEYLSPDSQKRKETANASTGVRNALCDVEISPRKPRRISMRSQAKKAKSSDRKYTVTLKEVQNALDKALLTLSKLDGECLLEAGLNANEGIKTPTFNNQGTINQSTIQETVSKTQEESLTFTSQAICSTISNMTDPSFNITLSEDVQNSGQICSSSFEEYHRHSLSKGITSDDNSLRPIPNEKDDKDSSNIDHTQLATTKIKNVRQEDKAICLIEKITTSPQFNSVVATTVNNNTDTQCPPLGPNIPISTGSDPTRSPCIASPDNNVSKEEPGTLSLITPTCTMKQTREETSETEPYSKSHADDTFATVSPTVQEGEESRDTTFPEQGHNAQICQTNSATAVIGQRSPECINTCNRNERGEGDSQTPRLSRSSQQENDVSENGQDQEFENLDMDLHTNKEAWVAKYSNNANDFKVGCSRPTSERKSRRNEGRETSHAMSKVTSDSLLVLGQNSRLLPRHIPASDTLLCQTLTPGNCEISRRGEETNAAPVHLKQQALEGVINVLEGDEGGRGEASCHTPTKDSEVDRASVNACSVDVTEQHRKRGIRKRFSSFLSTCWRRK